jgi:hypothetical protein
MCGRRLFAEQLADAGITALAHLACASAAIPPSGSRAAAEAVQSVAGALKSLQQLDELLWRAQSFPGAAEQHVKPVRAMCGETIPLLQVLGVELRAYIRRAKLGISFFPGLEPPNGARSRRHATGG